MKERDLKLTWGIAVLGVAAMTASAGGAQAQDGPGAEDARARNSPGAEDARFEALAHDYVEALLAMNPELATALGDHRYDDRLDDYTLEGVRKNLDRERDFRDRLARIDPSRLGETDSVDYRILEDSISSSIFSLDVLREREWNPLEYNVGNAIYGLLARNFAPLEQRLEAVGERLKQVPAVVRAAEANLSNPPKIHTETAISQNQGAIDLIGPELDGFLERAPGMKRRIEPAQQAALAALEAYGKWLRSDLLPRSNGDFRLGEEKFRAKLAHTLDSELSMEQILARAERSLAATQQAMYETALPLYRRYAPNADREELRDRKRVIKTALDKLAEKHPTNATIVDQARADLDEATGFVRDHRLVSLPDKPIDIIVMPEFERGVAVAYADSPGPLERNGETFFAIAPTPKDWTPARVASFYREYNDYMLEDLTVHEAMPGHYLQLAHANAFRAPTKVRAIFSSGTFIEGWAVYGEELMARQGYGGPEFKMQQLKMHLRSVINAILDQKIHTAGMTEQQAMDLMMNEGFQEEGEAAGKWRRAALTSTQLSTYFVGYSEIVDLRKAYEAKHGPITDERAFHDELLSFGSPPAKYVKELMGL